MGGGKRSGLFECSALGSSVAGKVVVPGSGRQSQKYVE